MAGTAAGKSFPPYIVSTRALIFGERVSKVAAFEIIFNILGFISQWHVAPPNRPTGSSGGSQHRASEVCHPSHVFIAHSVGLFLPTQSQAASEQ